MIIGLKLSVRLRFFPALGITIMIARFQLVWKYASLRLSFIIFVKAINAFSGKCFRILFIIWSSPGAFFLWSLEMRCWMWLEVMKKFEEVCRVDINLLMMLFTAIRSGPGLSVNCSCSEFARSSHFHWLWKLNNLSSKEGVRLDVCWEGVYLSYKLSSLGQCRERRGTCPTRPARGFVA